MRGSTGLKRSGSTEESLAVSVSAGGYAGSSAFRPTEPDSTGFNASQFKAWADKMPADK